MNSSKPSYRFFSLGLIVMLIASFSLPTITACAMGGLDCHADNKSEDMNCCEMTEKAASNSATESDCHEGEGEVTCEEEKCSYKQTPGQAGVVELNKIQVTEVTSIIISFIVSLQEPFRFYTEKVNKYNTEYTDSSPIYLMNRVMLN